MARDQLHRNLSRFQIEKNPLVSMVNTKILQRCNIKGQTDIGETFLLKQTVQSAT